jgi:hypothetical protein
LITRSILHIGFHKTGSTSIQHFAGTFRDRLSALGVAFYRGQHLANNHVELHVAAMRPDRITPFKAQQGIAGGDEYRQTVATALENFKASTAQSTALFSAEGLSYLREPAEIAWLRSCLGEDVVVIACLRNLRDYKVAYRHMLERHGIAPSTDKDSIAYLAEDSWLWRFSERLRPFREQLGSGQVTVIDYDFEMRTHGNIIPAWLRALGLERHFAPDEWEAIFLNRRPTTVAAR